MSDLTTDQMAEIISRTMREIALKFARKADDDRRKSLKSERSAVTGRELEKASSDQL